MIGKNILVFKEMKPFIGYADIKNFSRGVKAKEKVYVMRVAEIYATVDFIISFYIHHLIFVKNLLEFDNWHINLYYTYKL